MNKQIKTMAILALLLSWSPMVMGLNLSPEEEQDLTARGGGKKQWQNDRTEMQQEERVRWKDEQDAIREEGSMGDKEAREGWKEKRTENREEQKSWWQQWRDSWQTEETGKPAK